MTDDSRLENDTCAPAELQPKLPKRFRLAARSIYCLVGSILVSIAIATFIILLGAFTPKEIKDRSDLAREGSLTYTNDVRVGGMRSATVFYTFTYNGKSYSGKTYLPTEYSKKVLNYSRSGNFPVLFLPENPSINHPSDWRGNGPFPFIGYILIVVLVIQWTGLIRFIRPDLRLARNGVVAIGRVTECFDGRNGGIYLKYEFRDMDGLLMDGRGEYPARLNQGAQIFVLYLPEASGSSRPYPPAYFRSVQ
jgi:hypothetical protein